MDVASVTAIFGLLAAILAFGSAYDTFTSIGLPIKLMLTAAAALALLIPSASWFLTLQRAQPNRLAAMTGQSRRRSLSLFLAYLFVQALICLAAVALALFLTNRFTLGIRETTSSGASSTMLTAPEMSVDSFTIEAPPKKVSACDWENVSLEKTPPLQIQMIGWESQTPKLHIDNFVYPQRIKITCKPAHDLLGGLQAPPRTEMYFESEKRRLRNWIMALGVVAWLVAFGAMWRLSA